jgi:hypothetical protein
MPSWLAFALNEADRGLAALSLHPIHKMRESVFVDRFAALLFD